MKKILLAITLVAISTTAVQAQQISPVKFGVRAGLNFANMTESAAGVSYTPDSRTSFHVGIALEHPIGMNGFLFETGLYFSSKGCLYPEREYGVDVKLVTNYIQVPLLAGYRFDVSPRIAIKPFLGGYAAYGLSGKMKAEGYSFDVMSDNGIAVEGIGTGKLKRFDAGLRFGAGVELDEHYTLSLGYELGLNNIDGSRMEGHSGTSAKAHNSNFTLTLGYNF